MGGTGRSALPFGMISLFLFCAECGGRAGTSRPGGGSQGARDREGQAREGQAREGQGDHLRTEYTDISDGG
jgi:hypothetical protein